MEDAPMPKEVKILKPLQVKFGTLNFLDYNKQYEKLFPKLRFKYYVYVVKTSDKTEVLRLRKWAKNLKNKKLCQCYIYRTSAIV